MNAVSMNIYLDIDGVLIHDGLQNYDLPVNGALELLKVLTEKYSCYWLTTHCRGGENRAPEFLLRKLPEAKEYIEKIKPTEWSLWKTEAIDFTKDFRWIDDDVYDQERSELERRGCLEKLIVVNLREEPDRLKNILTEL